jgi:hypothetical protein
MRLKSGMAIAASCALTGCSYTTSPGDDRGLVESGVYWSKHTDVSACPNRFPILYGQPLEGKPFLPPGVQAKPLKVGIVYSVETSGSGSGYGSGRFRIRPDHTVENLPRHDASSSPRPGSAHAAGAENGS